MTFILDTSRWTSARSNIFRGDKDNMLTHACQHNPSPLPLPPPTPPRKVNWLPAITRLTVYQGALRLHYIGLDHITAVIIVHPGVRIKWLCHKPLFDDLDWSNHIWEPGFKIQDSRYFIVFSCVQLHIYTWRSLEQLSPSFLMKV